MLADLAETCASVEDLLRDSFQDPCYEAVLALQALVRVGELLIERAQLAHDLHAWCSKQQVYPVDDLSIGRFMALKARAEEVLR